MDRQSILADLKRSIKKREEFIKSWLKSIAIVACLIALIYGTCWALGISWHVVEGKSMIPTYYEGDIVVAMRADPNVINVGDVIVFRSPLYWNKLIVHRVIEKRLDMEVRFTTKGDNNPGPGLDDVNIPSSNVIGKVVFSIPKLGLLRNELSVQVIGGISRGMLLVLVGLAIIIFYDYRSWRRRTIG